MSTVGQNISCSRIDLSKCLAPCKTFSISRMNGQLSASSNSQAVRAIVATPVSQLEAVNQSITFYFPVNDFSRIRGDKSCHWQTVKILERGYKGEKVNLFQPQFSSYPHVESDLKTKTFFISIYICLIIFKTFYLFPYSFFFF